MKIVLSWVFDHINAPLNAIDVNDLTKQLTQKTTEIESVSLIKRNKENFSLAQIELIKNDLLFCITQEGVSIKVTKTAGHTEGEIVLIYHDNEKKEWRLANSIDLGATRHFSLPALQADDKISPLASLIESEFVLEISNNAIAHRPDLWSHRGFAREIAAIYDFSLKPIDSFIHQMKITTDAESITTTVDSPFSITIENKSASTRFAGLYIKSIQNKKTNLDMMARLSLLDCKSIDTVVDCTNYVMYDIGQPIHTYDADLLTEKRIVVRTADQNSELTLIDNKTIKLSNKDIIVADGLTPVALAGIMGGAQSKVTTTTSSLFIESAHFDAYLIRQTTIRHDLRTESAIRFSRNIDPNQNIFGIMRYIKLLDQYKLQYQAATTIQSVGSLIEPTYITILHSFIEKRLGTTITSQRIAQLLKALGFEVEKQNETYQIIIPTSRSKRDITTPEDIVEEIGRLFGYDTITPELPFNKTQPKQTINQIRIMRSIKNLLSFGFCMRELHNYALFDEKFLNEIRYHPENTVTLKNPISNERTRLVSTLLVHLLQVVKEHKDRNYNLRFFEIARCWEKNQDGTVSENQKIGGIMFSKTTPIDFYTGKQYVDRLCLMRNITATYKPIQTSNLILFDTIQSADVFHNDLYIGRCGISNPSINKILFEEKPCFMFELNKTIIETESDNFQYKEISKFPSVSRDISLLLSHQEITSDLIKLIERIDTRIRSIEVIDFFDKKEWGDKRALTIRIVIQDNEKTLSSIDVDGIITVINKECEQRGIQIR